MWLNTHSAAASALALPTASAARRDPFSLKPIPTSCATMPSSACGSGAAAAGAATGASAASAGCSSSPGCGEAGGEGSERGGGGRRGQLAKHLVKQRRQRAGRWRSGSSGASPHTCGPLLRRLSRSSSCGGATSTCAGRAGEQQGRQGAGWVQWGGRWRQAGQPQ